MPTASTTIVDVTAHRSICLLVPVACALATAFSSAACDRATSNHAVVVPIASAAPAPTVVVSSAPRDEPKKKEECAAHDVGDSLAARLLPRGALGFCVDGASTKSYGELATYKLDDTCSTLLDGECEAYIRNGARRIVSTRYVTADGEQIFYALVTEFAKPEGAYELFRRRTQSIAAQLSPGVVVDDGISIAVYDVYFVELTFVAEVQLSPGDAASIARRVGRALATDIAKRLRDAR
jgi:hypothetical protein